MSTYHYIINYNAQEIRSEREEGGGAAEEAGVEAAGAVEGAEGEGGRTLA
jgi:hypothetical protein